MIVDESKNKKTQTSITLEIKSPTDISNIVKISIDEPKDIEYNILDNMETISKEKVNGEIVWLFKLKNLKVETNYRIAINDGLDKFYYETKTCKLKLKMINYIVPIFTITKETHNRAYYSFQTSFKNKNLLCTFKNKFRGIRTVEKNDIKSFTTSCSTTYNNLFQ